MVDENEYRSAYRSINQRRCVFEKAVLTRRCDCAYSARFYLADREGISCSSVEIYPHCSRFLHLLRENAKFALKLTSLDSELPHAKEIKVQNGGLLGIQRVLRPDLGTTHVANVAGLISLGEKTFGSLEHFPYREIVKSISRFEGRRRNPSRH